MDARLINLLRLFVDCVDESINRATLVLKSLLESSQHAKHWLHDLREAHVAVQLSIDDQLHDGFDVFLEFGFFEYMLVESVYVVVLEAAEVQWQGLKHTMFAILNKVYKYVEMTLAQEQLEDFVGQRCRLVVFLITLNQLETSEPWLKLRFHLSFAYFLFIFKLPHL